MKKGFFAVLFTMISMLLIFQPASAISKDRSASEEPVIGVILPFSSAFVNIAEEQKNAIEIAMSETGFTGEVIFKDGKGDPASAVQAFKELAERKQPPVAVISCSSWASDAIHPLAAKEDIFHIAIGSAIIDRTEPRRTVRFTVDGKKEERQLSQYLSQFNRIAVFNMDNGYGNNWAKIVSENFQDKIVASIAYDPQGRDFGPQLAAIKKQNPDVLVLLSAGNAARIAKQAREIGITAQFVGTRPIERPELLDVSETDGLIYTYPSYSFKHHFMGSYEKLHKTAPTFFGIEAYDAFSTLIAAMNEGGNSPDALFDWYAGSTCNGALGEVRFDEKGDASYPYMYKQIVDGQFQVADFQFALLLEKTRQQISGIFREMDKSLEMAAQELSAVGIKGKKTEKILQDLYDANPYSYDCATVDPDGIIVSVAPEKFDYVIGADISDQEQIKRLHETHEPVVSQAIDTIEGFMGFDLEYPIFNEEGKFIGSLSILTKPDFFGSVITGKIANFPVEIWMIQKDGLMIYDINEEEIGRNLFTDELYANHPSLLKVGRQMATSPQGSGRYSFFDKKLETIVEKEMIWTTVAMHGTEFRLALVHVANDFR